MAARKYEEAWEAFSAQQYAVAQAISSETARLYPEHELMPKFMLLDAMATGAIEGEMAYKEKLDSLVARYPATDEGRRAAEITDFLRREMPAVKEAEDTRIAEEIYHSDRRQPHWVMIIAGNAAANMNQMVFDVINYNLDTYPEMNYTTQGTAVDRGYILITTGPFSDAAEAEAWITSFDPATHIREADSADLSVRQISRDNLENFREDKDIDRYLIFYRKEYGAVR